MQTRDNSRIPTSKNYMTSVSHCNKSSKITTDLFHIYLIYETTSEFDSNEAHYVPGTSYLFCIIHTITRTTVMNVRITVNVPATVRYRWEIIMQVNRQVYHSMHLIILVIKMSKYSGKLIKLKHFPSPHIKNDLLQSCQLKSQSGDRDMRYKCSRLEQCSYWHPVQGFRPIENKWGAGSEYYKILLQILT